MQIPTGFGWATPLVDMGVPNYVYVPPPPAPDEKDDCKKGGWELYGTRGFRNQGDCVSYVQSNENAGKRD